MMGGPGRAFVHQSRGGLGRAARLNAARRAGWGGWRGRAPQRGRSGEGSEVEFRAVMGDNDGGRRCVRQWRDVRARSRRGMNVRAWCARRKWMRADVVRITLFIWAIESNDRTVRNPRICLSCYMIV